MPSASAPVPAPQAPRSDDDSYEWNPYVIGPLVIVCIAVLIFSYYRVLKRLLAAINTVIFGNQVGMSMRHSNLNEIQEPSMQFQSQGLESTVMHSLPISQYKKKKADEEANECAVCLGEFEEGEWIKHLPVCAHVFHVACIDTWFQAHSNCPICRSLICEDCSLSMNSLIESLRREDFFDETTQTFQILRSEILQNIAQPVQETAA
ncbi:RING/U-box superfamily protein [Euphorbia peplus]|nr:RING/U-box superfamily protein [Euphorbia peplus]